MEDLIESDLRLYVNPYFYKQLVNLENPNKLERKIVEKSTESLLAMNPSKLAGQLANYKNSSTVLLESELKVYRKLPLKALLGSYFPPSRVSYGLRNRLPLHEPINKAIRRLIAGGLVYKWIDEIEKQYKDDTEVEEHIVLKMKHLGSAWIVFLGGFTIGFPVFIVEHLIHVFHGSTDF